jgi:DNA-binding transcriptional LysR family regulator
MSQSPLSRAIRELERELGVVLFVRTTRHVEVTPAGSALLHRARSALAEIDAAVDEARRAARPNGGALRIGYTPFTLAQATRIAAELERERPELQLRLDEGVTKGLLPRVAAGELTAALVMQTPAAARHYGVRIDALGDEPLLAALPETHPYARAETIPVAAFAAECVLLPRDPPGGAFNLWLRAVLRAAGAELEHTRETLSAPWDRRMLPVAEGEAVSLFVREWVQEPIPGVAAVPFDPPLSLPIDLASSSTDGAQLVVETARRVRDADGWLELRPARIELPDD